MNRVTQTLVTSLLLLTSTAAVMADEISQGLSSNDRPGGHIDKMVNLFAEGVVARSDGRVRATVFPNQTLAAGDFRTQLELTRSGTIYIAVNSTIILGLFTDRRCDVFSMRLNISDFDEFDLIVLGPMGDKMNEWMSESVYQALGFGINGFRQLTNSERPV